MMKAYTIIAFVNPSKDDLREGIAVEAETASAAADANAAAADAYAARIECIWHKIETDADIDCRDPEVYARFMQ